MPKVSIILPTYNRADTILRAIKSVQAQTFTDWELVVVDDGSRDNTSALITGIEPRMVLIRQENRGFTEARNTGIRASVGEYLAFIDSDDEFLPHHLELCVAFLEAFPTEQFVSTELLEDFGEGEVVQHYRIETSEWYPHQAAAIGSRMLDLPPGESDDYLRVYESREPIGDWGSRIVERANKDRDGFLYRGRIFDYLRWGYLIAITASVIRRTALEKVGLPEASRGTASDFHFLASLCRNFRTNYLSVPTFVKHELNSEGKVPALGHVVTGDTALLFSKEMLRAWEDLFWNYRRNDRELCALRGLRQFKIAKGALQAQQRDAALEYLQEARKSLPYFWRAVALEWVVRYLPQLAMSRKAWTALGKGTYATKQLVRGDLSPRVFLSKARAQIR